jgi:membrane complex biogenesis BtpA family protein
VPRTPRFADLFATAKPVIAMAHLPPLPGTPLYDDDRGVAGIIATVQADLEILLAAGVDGVMFCNEGDRPYELRVGVEAVAVLTRVVAELAPRDRPFGVDLLWDARAALAVAVATGAAFMREVTTGAYESDMGLWNTDAAGLLRERRRLGGDRICVLMNVTPEYASPLGRRSIADVARSAVVSSLADAILVSGPMAGTEPALDAVREACEAVAARVPVLVNTGAKSTNVRDFLATANGVIVGSDLKVDGNTWNPVDRARVERFLTAARS